MHFSPGTLLDLARARITEAKRNGALVPFQCSAQIYEQDGVQFIVRKMEAPTTKPSHLPASQRPKGHDPFLPFEEDLHVADASDIHVVLLNKFNVLDVHLVIVPRVYRDQRTLLVEEDFTALWRCLREFDGLAFYNGGPHAGASVAHQHLQLVELPLLSGAPKSLAVPLESKFARGLPNSITEAELPYRNAVVTTGCSLDDPPTEAGKKLWRRYRELLLHLGQPEHDDPLDDPPDDPLEHSARDRGMSASIERERSDPAPPGSGERQPFPYNLLLRRNWLMVVPRTQAEVHQIQMNALGYAGALLVRGESEAQVIENIGIFSLLAEAGVRRH